MRRQEFLQGIKDGIPIALGYFSVSMAFGLTAALSGLPIWSVVLISMTNLTSAGQFAGVNIMLALGALTDNADNKPQIFSDVAFVITASRGKNEHMEKNDFFLCNN